MSDDPSKIGLQHPAFAVSKNTLLSWLNDFFELNYTKVEECATGAVYCQILDCIYPGKVQMKQVNWQAKNDYEYVQNFKIVQKVMTQNKITKPVPIDRLVKAKYQDNLEFLQWFKHFFECRYAGQAYNAAERRSVAKKALVSTGSKKKSTSSSTQSSSSGTATRSSSRPVSARTKASSPGDKDVESSLNEEIAALQATVEGLEKERDFYFGKLREVEVLCQGEEQHDNLKELVLQILYKTDEDGEGDEMEVEAEDGEAQETF